MMVKLFAVFIYGLTGHLAESVDSTGTKGTYVNINCTINDALEHLAQPHRLVYMFAFRS